MVVCERAYWAFTVRMRDTTGRYTEQSKLDLAGAGFIYKDQPELKKSMQNPILTCRPVLNTSVLLQRVRILVPAIAQGLTRRPVATCTSRERLSLSKRRRGIQHRATKFSACRAA